MVALPLIYWLGLKRVPWQCFVEDRPGLFLTPCSAAQIRRLELSRQTEPLLSRMLSKQADLHFSVDRLWEHDEPRHPRERSPARSISQRNRLEDMDSQHLRWHKENIGDEGKLCHPRDGESWKHFDWTQPTFAAEPRNVRLALSTNGFNPHIQGSRPYSCRPVIVTPYNLPPWMCMD
ncbi:hypothetical protein KSP39_PZI016022 [Platanthera zijinensis]|uniref:Uncharacterized protein n=1 Tax=Platanthera zijinensis TaxID=2320716 RepID=A0AAP0B9G1_9ASPA